MHDLRHYFGSLLISQGLNVVYVSRQLGHASPKITLDVYAHLFDAAEHSQKASDALDAALGNTEVTAGGDTRRNRVVAAGGQVGDLQRKGD